MDHKQECSFLANNHILPPAQLFIGNHDKAVKKVESFLQTIFCTRKGCSSCITCQHITKKQHHAIMWLHPEKNYTLEQLEELFTTLSFQLQEKTLFFFVIQKADFLSTTCANKLLKPMEEPPTGYHFILLAEHAEHIPVTIKSRCIIHILNSDEADYRPHPLVEIFTKKMVDSDEFSKLVSATSINERESMELLDEMLHYWFMRYRQNKQTDLVPVITKLQHAQLHPPMPGSSSIFWRNLYLQLHNLIEKTH